MIRAFLERYERCIGSYDHFVRDPSSFLLPRSWITSLSKRRVFLIVRPLDALKADERADLQELCRASRELETLHTLVQSFGQIVRKREGQRLPDWIKQVTDSGLDVAHDADPEKLTGRGLYIGVAR